MSTAIAASTSPVGLVDFPSLMPDSRQLRVIEANLDGEPIRIGDLTRVTTPAAGATKWTVTVNGNDETTDEIVGLLVCIAKRGTLWPHDDPSDKRPVIVSSDLKTGYRVSDDLGSLDPAALEKYRTGGRTYDWVAIDQSPEFGWHAKKRLVKEARILAILREGDVWPILVTVGPGSLGDWVKFQKTLPSFHYETIVGLKLKKEKNAGGQPFSMVVPRVVGVVSEAVGEVARRVYTEPLKAMFSEVPRTAD